MKASVRNSFMLCQKKANIKLWEFLFISPKMSFWYQDIQIFGIFPFAGTIIRSSNSLHGLSSAIFWITQNTFALRHQNLPDDESLKKTFTLIWQSEKDTAN